MNIKKILGKVKYEPRSHFPVDVFAASYAKKMKAEFIIMDGRDLNNMDKFIHSMDFKGTIIAD